MPQPPPTDGQFFTLQPVQAPKPKPAMSWGLPIALGLLAIPLLMLGFGFAQQQTPATSTAATKPAAPSPALSPSTVATTPQTASTATPNPSPTPEAAPPSDAANLPTAAIQAIGVAANFRAAPSLHSQVLGVLLHGDLVQLGIDRRVQQDGVVWVPVRWRGQSGWVARNFIGGAAHANP